MNSRRLLPCLGALLCALLAFAASASASTAPVVKSVSPMKLRVGEKLTLKGARFTPGAGKTRVFFVRRGGGTAFARSESGTRRRLVVTVPARMDDVLEGKRARIRIRVLTKKFSKLTEASKSPIIAPSDGSFDTTVNPTDPGATGPAAPEADCDLDGTPNSLDADDDNDLLTDEDETKLALDPCKADTDGDNVEDAYEYYSALDLNRTVLFGATPPTPYPGKRPYPNPLFKDADTDFDGDGLSLGDEYSLWAKFGGHTTPLNYSDGLQTTVPTPLPSDPLLEQLDSSSASSHYNDGMLDDGERDADGDGLGNWDESHGRMTQGWWTKTYAELPETPYVLTYSGVSMTDADTDGDGVLDGADDEDHDGLSNQFEVARPWDWAVTYVSLGHSGTNPYARVQPYNPCKPVWSDACHRHPPFDYYADNEDWAGIDPASAGAPGVTPGPIFAP